MAKLPSSTPRDGTAAADPAAVLDQSEDDLRAQLAQLTDDYHEVCTGDDPWSKQRRGELAAEIRAVRKVLVAMEPMTEVVLRRIPTGHPLIISGHAFYPGTHHVRVSVAETLRYMQQEAFLAEDRRNASRVLEMTTTISRGQYVGQTSNLLDVTLQDIMR